MSETEMYNNDPMSFVNDIIGDLKDKHILDETKQIGSFCFKLNSL